MRLMLAAPAAIRARPRTAFKDDAVPPDSTGMRLEQTCAECGGAVASQGILPESAGGPVHVYACSACGEYWMVSESEDGPPA